MSVTAAARWTDLARRYADALLRHGLDHYGSEGTPMWVQMIDLRTLEIPAQRTAEEWDREMATWEEDRGYDHWTTSKHGTLFAPMSNLNWDGSNIRLMRALTDDTGDAQYRRAADDYMAAFVERCVSPVNGLFAWGLHMAYDVRKGAPDLRWHELNMWDRPVWEELLAAHPEATLGAIRGIYDWHVQDKRTYAFDRKAEFWAREFTHETLNFWHHAPMYVDAFVAAWGATGDDDYLTWARDLVTSLWAKRHPETGLIPGLWVPDIRRDGECSRFDAYTWPIEYLLAAYETSRDALFLDAVESFLGAPGRTTLIEPGDNAPRAARVALRAGRHLGASDLIEVAAEYAHVAARGIPLPTTAFPVAQTMFLLLDLHAASGNVMWLDRAVDYAGEAERLFFHESGLLAGAVGLKRPLYYDAAHGPGMLALAFHRLGAACAPGACVDATVPPLASAPPAVVVRAPDVPESVCAGATVSVRVRIGGADAVERVVVRTLVDDAFGYADVELARDDDGFAGNAQLPADEQPRRISFGAVATCTNGRERHGPWTTRRVHRRDDLVSDEHGSWTDISIGGAEGGAVARSYWWWPGGEGAAPSFPIADVYYSIEGADRNTDAKTVEIPVSKELVQRFMPGSLRLAHGTEDGGSVLISF